MCKRIAGVMAVLVLGATMVWAQETKAPDSTQAQTARPVEVGNKICPVSGEKIKKSEMGEPVKIEHNGKIYGLCCPMCIKDFKKDPDKYAAIADKEVSNASVAP